MMLFLMQNFTKMQGAEKNENPSCWLRERAARSFLVAGGFSPATGKLVVAPSLTPEDYNNECFTRAAIDVVAPSLTPEDYNIFRS